MPDLENITFDEINISDQCHYKKKMTEKNLILFSAVSGDVNPVHLDKEFAANSIFKERIAHGMWSASLVSATLATVMPGPGTIYLSQSIEFHRPVKVEDELEVTLIASSKDEEKKTVTFLCDVKNQLGKSVASGEAVVIAPTKKIKVKKPELPEIIIG